MPGVEVQANVFDALRRGAAVMPLSPWVSAAVATVMVVVLMLILLYAEARTGLLASFSSVPGDPAGRASACISAAGGSGRRRRCSAACSPIPCGAGAGWSLPSVTWTPS
jgi:hypothetical protein